MFSHNLRTNCLRIPKQAPKAMHPLDEPKQPSGEKGSLSWLNERCRAKNRNNKSAILKQLVIVRSDAEYFICAFLCLDKLDNVKNLKNAIMPLGDARAYNSWPMWNDHSPTKLRLRVLDCSMHAHKQINNNRNSMHVNGLSLFWIFLWLFGITFRVSVNCIRWSIVWARSSYWKTGIDNPKISGWINLWMNNSALRVLIWDAHTISGHVEIRWKFVYMIHYLCSLQMHVSF